MNYIFFRNDLQSNLKMVLRPITPLVDVIPKFKVIKDGFYLGKKNRDGPFRVQPLSVGKNSDVIYLLKNLRAFEKN